MPRIENPQEQIAKEIQPTEQIVEVEVNLSLINQKINYLLAKMNEILTLLKK